MFVSWFSLGLGKPGESSQEGNVDILEDLTLTKLAGVARIGHIWRTCEFALVFLLRDWNALGLVVAIEQHRFMMRMRDPICTLPGYPAVE